ncbi:hypothetical protein lerEdw1_000975 [Lerista edwardsae]|nr:hypothetical protein lerEdw1_000975 [Lerista edwardsae]
MMNAIFAGNRKEHPEPIQAEVHGKIPSWMEGILLRNGPGMHTIGESKFNHWFDGMALLHSFTIKNGMFVNCCTTCHPRKRTVSSHAEEDFMTHHHKYEPRDGSAQVSEEETFLDQGAGGSLSMETGCRFAGLQLEAKFKSQVFYRSKYLRSDTYNRNIEANRIVVSEFGTMAYPDPCKNIFAKAFSYLSHTIPEFTDNCLINIMKNGEDFYATAEVNFAWKIDPWTLESLEKVDYTKYVAINLATSHPHYDSFGNILNMGTSIVDKGKTKYVIFKIPPSAPAGEKKKTKCLEHLEVLCSIPSRSLLHPSYYHSFGVSENYVIFVEQPFKLDILKMATAYIRKVDWASCLVFNKDEKTWIHLIDKQTKKDVPVKIYTDALVLFHHVNAYEEDNHMVFDVICYTDHSLYQLFYLKNFNDSFESNAKFTSVPSCKRFVVPLRHDKDAEVGTNLVQLPSTTATAMKDKDGNIYCQPEVLCEGTWSPTATAHPVAQQPASLPSRSVPPLASCLSVSTAAHLPGIELPRINYNYNGKKYRYIFAPEVKWSPIPTEIVKFDILTRKCLHWKEEHCWPAEPVFVPSPDAKEEDDGIILSNIVTSDPQKLPFLLILDAKTFKEIARATVSADVHLDLHGIFIPEKELKMEHKTDSDLGQE